MTTRQIIVFIFTLSVSFLLAYTIGENVFISATFRLNPEIKKRLSQAFNDLTKLPFPTDISKVTPLVSYPNASPTQLLLPSVSTVVTIESLAQCLADRNFTMYGTPECPSCVLQREYFGDSFAFVPYVNCNESRELCQSKSVSAYPTWEDRDGKKYKGAIPLNTLAELSGCPAPLNF